MIELNEKASIYAEENVINVLKEAFFSGYKLPVRHDSKI